MWSMLQSGGKPRAVHTLARGSAVSIAFVGSCASLFHGTEEIQQRASESEGGNSGCDRRRHTGACHQAEMATVLQEVDQLARPPFESTRCFSQGCNRGATPL